MIDNNILINLNVVVFFLSENIIMLLQGIIIYFAILFLKKWDFNSHKAYQYKLEDYSYFVEVLVLFSFIIKIFLFGYFTYVLDSLSDIIPGAMCGAGVISANKYGEPLLINKTISIFMMMVWIILDRLDLSQKTFLYFKTKYKFYIAIFVILLVEFILDIYYFINLSTVLPVTCCSAIYSNSTTPTLPFDMSLNLLLSLFYGLFLGLILANIFKKEFVSFILSGLFLYFSYYSILYFFGTYVYELPTHHCPFCMLQKDYYYVGYFIFIFLFLGSFFGMVNYLIKLFTNHILSKYFIYSTIFSSIFVCLVSLYVIVYYIKNGVLL